MIISATLTASDELTGKDFATPPSAEKFRIVMSRLGTQLFFKALKYRSDADIQAQSDCGQDESVGM